MGINRREFAKLSFLYSLASLARPIATFAAEPKPLEGHYLQINFFGAPSRWLYDLPLTPSSDSKFIESNYVTSSIQNKNGELKCEYQTKKINGLQLPLLWSEGLNINGKVLDQKHIYNNMLIIRGCNMAIDGHEINNRKLVNPFSTGNSITGQISNISNKPYPTIQLLGKASPLSTAPGAFFSSQNLNPINIASGEDYGSQILKFGKYEKYHKVENDLLTLLSGKEDKTRTAVVDILKKDLDKIYSYYISRVEEYKKIINNNIKISKYLSDINGYQFTKKAQSKENSIRAELGAYFYDGYILCADNLADISEGLDYSQLAHRFAISETIIKFELSSSCVMMINPVEKVRFKNVYSENDLQIEKGSRRIVPKKGAKPKDIVKDFTFDTHDHGLISEAILNDQFFRVFQSCLLELVITLKKTNKFNDTLIHLTSEFDRTPRIDESGSDHGWQGHTSTLISGSINGTYLTGDIHSQNPDEGALHYGNGTWGAGAPSAELQGRHMSYRNIISTISYLMNIPSITPSDISLVNFDKKNKKLKLLLGKGKNV